MRTTVRILVSALLFVFPAIGSVYAADQEMTVETGAARVARDGVAEAGASPLAHPLVPLRDGTQDPVVTWIAFPASGNSISSGFPFGSTITHTVWTCSLKSGNAKAVLSIWDLRTGKKVKTQTFNLNMTAGKSYTVTMSYKPATNQHIYYFIANVYFTGITKMTTYNSGFCKYFTY